VCTSVAHGESLEHKLILSSLTYPLPHNQYTAMDSYMISRDFFSGSNAENDAYMLITTSTCSMILDDYGPLSTKLVDRFHGVLV
jgi:hypothetical protein